METKMDWYYPKRKENTRSTIKACRWALTPTNNPLLPQYTSVLGQYFCIVYWLEQLSSDSCYLEIWWKLQMDKCVNSFSHSFKVFIAHPTPLPKPRTQNPELLHLSRCLSLHSIVRGHCLTVRQIAMQQSTITDIIKNGKAHLIMVFCFNLNLEFTRRFSVGWDFIVSMGVGKATVPWSREW